MAPLWMDEVCARLDHLAGLGPNWDGYGAAAIDRDAAFGLVYFLAEWLDETSIAPFISPVSNGHLQVEWHRAGVGELEIEIYSRTNQVDVLYVPVDGDVVEELLYNTDERIPQWVKLVAG